MITLCALAVACVVLVVVFSVVLALIGLPLMIIGGLLPWVLRLAGVVLLVKALLDRPTRWENFLPALGAFVLSLALGWVF